MARLLVASVALLAACLAAVTAFAADAPACHQAARARAAELLAFHYGPDPDSTAAIEIDDAVKELRALRNPAQPQQLLPVLEVWGYIYKAQYRMRFIYAPGPGCTLVGEEILEHGAF